MRPHPADTRGHQSKSSSSSKKELSEQELEELFSSMENERAGWGAANPLEKGLAFFKVSLKGGEWTA